jgi:hypothetical protein
MSLIDTMFSESQSKRYRLCDHTATQLRYRQKQSMNWTRSCTPITAALRRLRQEDCEFEATLGYTVRTCLKKTKRNTISDDRLTLVVVTLGRGRCIAYERACGSLLRFWKCSMSWSGW